MANKVRLAVGLDLGSTNTRMVICAIRRRRNPFSRAWRSAVHGMESRPTGRSGGARRRAFVSRCRKRSGARRCRRRRWYWASAAERIRHEQPRAVRVWPKRQIENDDLRYAVELAARVRLEDEPTGAADLSAGFHAGWPRRLSQSARHHVRAAGSECACGHRVGSGTPRH